MSDIQNNRNISDAEQRDRAINQVIPSHRAKSHDYCDAHGGIYSVNVSIVVYKKFIILNCVHTFFFMHIF